MITLTAGPSKAEIIAEMGAGLASLWADEKPVLRPWSGRVQDGPFALACNLLVPFSNRISGGGFGYEGARHSLDPNLPGEVCPIHGDGFQRPWQAVDVTGDRAELCLLGGEIGPFRHSAFVRYHLTQGSLETRLSVTNTGDLALPFGLGLHPWFPRDDDTRLQFNATGQWPEGPGHLPTSPVPVPFGTACPWARPEPLPHGWINGGFSGWDGRARIVQGKAAKSLQIACTGLGTALIYSPSANADFFCFEPVSHPVDAHNLPSQPGLVRLAPGADFIVSMTLNWEHAA
jgi:aldose 1-epimerase